MGYRSEKESRTVKVEGEVHCQAISLRIISFRFSEDSKMKRLVKIGFLSLLVVALVAADSEAQKKKKGGRGGRRGQRGRFSQRGGFGRFGRGGGAAGLLRQESVQKEIKITDDQKKKIDTAFAELTKMMQELRDLPREERREAFQKIGELSQKAGKTAMSSLNKEQKKRLDQLMLQRSGARALQQEAVQKKLGFTRKQTRKMKSLIETQRDEQREMFREMRENGGGFEGMREKMQELQKKNNKAILDVLTKKQSEQFEKMKGKKFKFQSRRRRPDV